MNQLAGSESLLTYDRGLLSHTKMQIVFMNGWNNLLKKNVK